MMTESRQCSVWALASVILVVVVGWQQVQGEGRCPEPGMVWGGDRCIYRQTCEDGRAKVNGECIDICWDGRDARAEDCRGRPDPVVQEEPRELLQPIPPPKPELDCSFEVFLGVESLDIEQQTRRVLMSNGDVESLLNRYLDFAKKKGIDVGVQDLVLLFVETVDGRAENVEIRGSEEFDLDIGKVIIGHTPKSWALQSLRGRRADAIPRCREFAAQTGADDIVCGG